MKKLIILTTLLVSADSFGHWSKISSKSLDIAPPPVVGSLEFQQDFEKLFFYQQTRTEEQCAFARTQPHPEFDEMFLHTGPLTEEEALRAKPIVNRVMKLSERIASYHKKKYARVRPFNVEPSLKPCTFRPTGNTAYPSSHASSATAGACVLAYLYPAKSQAIIDYGQYLGELRVITGVHHPSDVQAGQDLAKNLCENLLSNDEFLSDLNKL
jgi:acid phosphatase (class A)